MFIYRNAEGVHDKKKVGNPWSRLTNACFPLRCPWVETKRRFDVSLQYIWSFIVSYRNHKEPGGNASRSGWSGRDIRYFMNVFYCFFRLWNRSICPRSLRPQQRPVLRCSQPYQISRSGLPYLQWHLPIWAKGNDWDYSQCKLGGTECSHQSWRHKSIGTLTLVSMKKNAFFGNTCNFTWK